MEEIKPKLLISFSGGRTSAYMLWYILNNWRDKYDIVVVFANTGKEHEGTLKFVHQCAEYFDIEIIWVEAYPRTKKGWGIKHKVVTYETASRKGEPFEAMISVLGIPNPDLVFCSDQMKRKAIESYLKSIGWKGYYKALGIRADEVDRINQYWKKKKILYPLIRNGTLKRDVVIFWAKMPFDLVIPKGQGNCDACIKKGTNDLVELAREDVKVFDWWIDMTDKYGHVNPRNCELNPPFNFYRGNKSPLDIIALAQSNYTQMELFEMDSGTGCITCEVTF